MEKLTNCLCCGSTDIKPYLVAKDNYSTEEFDIAQCANCGFIFTNPRPGQNDIVRYYSSPDYMSHHSHSKGLVQTVYRIARQYMMRKKLALIKGIMGKNNFSLLDFGCGTGDFLAYIKSQGIKAEGVEPDQQAREAAKQINRLDLFSVEASKNLPSESFDVVTLWHVLEHIHDLHAQIDEFQRWLKPHGKLIIAVPNIDSYDAQKYGRYWDALDVPRHIYHYSPNSIRQVVAQHGFRKENQYPLTLDAYYVSMRSEWHKGTPKWLAYFKALWSGYESNARAARTGNYSSLIYVFGKK